MASAILDFWTYDMVATAERSQRNEPGLQPHVFERPLLKFGATLVQLPWIVGLQNNSSAAINNLRRIGARPGQARGEAQRIEAGLAQLFETRGIQDAAELGALARHGRSWRGGPERHPRWTSVRHRGEVDVHAPISAGRDLVQRHAAGFIACTEASTGAGLEGDAGWNAAITPTRCFGSAANLNVRQHCLVLDGVYR